MKTLPSGKTSKSAVPWAVRKIAPVVAKRPGLTRGIADFLFLLKEEAIGIELPTSEVLQRLSPQNLKNVTIAEFIKALEDTNFFDVFSEGVYILDEKTNLLLANYTARRLYGAVGVTAPFPLARVLTEESLKEAIERISVASSEDPKEDLFLYLTKPDGTEIPIKTTPKLLELKDGRLIIGTVTPSILSALVKLHETIPGAKRIEEIFDLVLDYAMNLFRLDACAIKTDFNLSGNSFKVIAMKKLGEEYALPRSLPLIDTASYQAFESGNIIIKDGLSVQTSAASEFGMKSGMFVPLWVMDEASAEATHRIGTFCLYCEDPKKMDSLKRKLQQVRIFANFVAIRIQDARLQQKTLDYQQRILEESAKRAALNRVSQIINSSLKIEEILDILVKEARDLYQRGNEEVRSCSVYIYNEIIQKFEQKASVGVERRKPKDGPEPIKLGEGVIGEVGKTGKTLIVNDVEAYLKGERIEGKDIPDGQRKGSFVCVPIMGQEKIIGVLSISSEDKKYFESVQTLETLAGMAAIAIEKARLIIVDPLIPELLNRRAGSSMMQEELMKAKQSGAPLSVVVIDLDHFKPINDNYGHSNGDKVLEAVGKLLAKAGEETGIEIPYRFGGDEFVVGLPSYNKKSALKFAENLRDKIAGLSVKTDKGVAKVTASLGVVTFPDDVIWEADLDETWGRLFSRADDGSYHAKQEGGNQVFGVKKK